MDQILTVVIVTWNSIRYLPECIGSVLSCSLAGRLGLVVVDNNSTDDIVEVLERQFPNVRLIKNHTNKGFASACNQGIQAAQTKYVLLLNPDTLAGDRSLETMVDFMESHERAGACGPQIADKDGHVGPVATYPKIGRMLFKDTVVENVLPFLTRVERRFPNAPETTLNLSGACLMLRKKALEEAGALNPNLFLYHEEPELLERFHRKGWLSYFVPAAQITHLGEKSTAALASYDKILIERQSSFILWRSRYGAVATLGLKTVTFCACLTTLLWWLVRLPFQPNRAKAKIGFYWNLLGLVLGVKQNIDRH